MCPIGPFVQDSKLRKTCSARNNIPIDTTARYWPLRRRARGPIAAVGTKLPRDLREGIENTIKEKLQALFSERQRERLKQVAFQVEIYRAGIVEAITDGYFGVEIDVTAEQAKQLRTDSTDLEKKAIEDACRVIQSARDHVLVQLDPSQRNAASSLLGKAILFRE